MASTPPDTEPDPPPRARHERLALALLFVAPALFATNMLVARATAELIPPTQLALWRWVGAALILTPLTAGSLWRQRAALKREWFDLLILGALGMGVCGAFVYIGAATTTATNIGLIYSGAPVLIILIARFVYGEAMKAIQGLGVVLCFVGVLTVIVRGDPAVLTTLAFTVGDLWIVAATTGWALYSVLLKHRPTQLDTITRFYAIVLAGVVVLLPFSVWEHLDGRAVQWSANTVGWIALLAVVPAVGAYYTFAFITGVLGANRTSVFLYLLPFYNSIMAWLFLGEVLVWYHYAGGALLIPGLYLVTRGARLRGIRALGELAIRFRKN